MKRSLRVLAMAGLVLAAQAIQAQAHSPVGLWKTLDDSTGRPRALVRITEQAGVFEGRIEKLFLDPDEPTNPLCDKCEGDLKNRSIVGLTIVSGMHHDGAGFVGGRILDPESGQSYHATMRLAPDGRELVVRGYVAWPLFGRSQSWRREP